MDPERYEESEHQRREARQLRRLIPGGPGDLDDESDEGKQHSVIASHFFFGSFRASREVFLYYTISINSQGRFVHTSEKTNLIPKCVVPT